MTDEQLEKDKKLKEELGYKMCWDCGNKNKKTNICTKFNFDLLIDEKMNACASFKEIKKKKINFDKEVKNAIEEGTKYLSSLDSKEELNEKEIEVATRHYTLKRSYREKVFKDNQETKNNILNVAIDLRNFYRKNN